MTNRDFDEQQEKKPKEVVNPHDAVFKHFLGKPEIAADFLTQHLPSPILALLDLTTLEEQKAGFVDEELRNHFSDILYRVKTRRGRPVYLYHLFEHKSYPDAWVAFQLLRYKVRIWEEERLKSGTISPILGIVVYHGVAQWAIPQHFADLFRPKEDAATAAVQQADDEEFALLRPYLPDFAYQLVDLSAMTDEEIQGDIWLQVFERILKHIFDDDLGQQLYAILVLAEELIQQPSGVQMLYTLLKYVVRAGSGASKEEVVHTVLKLLPKEGEALMKSAAQEWFEEGEVSGFQKGEVSGFQKGEASGFQKGEVSGVQKARQSTIVQILQYRFALTAEMTEQIIEQLSRIEQIETLEMLTNLALQLFALPEFQQKLTEIAASPTPAKGSDAG